MQKAAFTPKSSVTYFNLAVEINGITKRAIGIIVSGGVRVEIM